MMDQNPARIEFPYSNSKIRCYKPLEIGFGRITIHIVSSGQSLKKYRTRVFKVEMFKLDWSDELHLFL